MTSGAPGVSHHEPIPSDWPAPDPADLERRDALKTRIRREIENAGGTLSFERFMELALYAPGIGYYSAPKSKFGRAGDYVTAPTLSPLLAQCLANQLADVLPALAPADILEVGAGDGALATDLLLALDRLGCLPSRYFILELSAGLCALQRETIARRAPQLVERVTWLESLPNAFRGVVIGNEVLDAMPVTRFRATTNDVYEQTVIHENDRLALSEQLARPIVSARVTALALASDYQSEFGLQAEAWVRSVGERLEQGLMLLIDYGFSRAEFYHPQRSRGTLMCHYRHRAHSDPLILIGLQDITAHVDFTAMAEAASDSGLDVLGYTSQAAFLIGCGLADLMAESVDPRAQIERAHAVNLLTAPQEMGELFKVIAVGRGVDVPLRGFAIQDRRARL